MDSTVLNYYNPASYNQMAKGQPLFSFGLSTRLTTRKQGEVSEFNVNSNFQHFAMAFPVRNHFGLAFGIKPFASRGYSFGSGESLGTDSVVYYYKGSGTLNEAFAGLSTDLLKLENTRLAIGMNAGYVFGETSNSRLSYLSGSSNAGGAGQRLAHLSSFHYNLGFYFNQSFRDQQLMFSGIIEPAQKLNGSFDDALYYAGNVFNETTYDTISFERVDGVVNNPMSLELGLTYKYLLLDKPTKTRKLNSELTFATSYGMTKWSEFSAPFNDSLVLNDTRKLTFGFQLRPEIKLYEKFATLKFYQKLEYRLGGYFNTLPYDIGGKQLTDKGLTFGVGIPVPTLRSLSSISFGFTIGNRGNGLANTLNENYYGINLGITIAPGSTERWFRNLKFN